ncbi:MAG: flagellar biosynthetic protein FliO [Myxococcales bacterium]|nr:flagellar biosynthetic protein FliO [Myxococcales bacterium]
MLDSAHSGLGAAAPAGYGLALVQSAVALVAVCLLAWVLLRWAARLGWGRAPRGGRVEVLERVPLDARRSLFVVRAGHRTLLVGVGDGAAPSLLGELDAAGAVPDAASDDPESAGDDAGVASSEERASGPRRAARLARAAGGGSVSRRRGGA